MPCQAASRLAEDPAQSDSFASGEVSELITHQEPAEPVSFTVESVSYDWGQGEVLFLNGLVLSSKVCLPEQSADGVIVLRRDIPAMATGANPNNIERLDYMFYGGSAALYTTPTLTGVSGRVLCQADDAEPEPESGVPVSLYSTPLQSDLPGRGIVDARRAKYKKPDSIPVRVHNAILLYRVDSMPLSATRQP